MNPEVHAFLSQTLVPSLGLPLRVAVYSRLVDGIHSNVFPLGSMLPRETELCAAIGLSRTVVREALMLLEEDGLIVTRRGVGRFVAESVPQVGLEEFRAFEHTLSDGEEPLKVVPGRHELQPVLDNIAQLLSLSQGKNIWFRESILYRGDEPVALVEEGVPSGAELEAINPKIAAAMEEALLSEETLLAAFIRLCGPVLTSESCTVSAGVAGAPRARQLNIRAQDPVLVLSQAAHFNGTPVYVAKCIVSPHAGQLNINRTTPAN